VLKIFDKHGVGYAYWFDNNYHYFKNWDHLKLMKTASRQGISVLNPPQDYKTLLLPESDKIMSRLISIQIRITWTDSELQILSATIEKALKEAL
jgi:8-amino-3,8-dideoxy-alpha-D-manno-octulosonate transaminase